MKKQRRWSSETEIITAINESLQRAHDLILDSERLESEADAMTLEASRIDLSRDSVSKRKQSELDAKIRELSYRAKKHRETARKQLKTATRIQDIKVKKLGQVLAAFRTLPMVPVCGTDFAVVEH